jgi:hypothetical protein
VLAEIAGHIEDVAERERRRGAGAQDAERVAIRRLGSARAVAAELSAARRETIALARQRALRWMAYLAAVLVLACASLARLTTGDADGHLGLEVVAAVAALIAVLLIDGWRRAGARVGSAVVCVVGVWIAASAALVGAGDVAFCGQVLLGVGGAATILHAARRVRLGPRRGAP